MRRSRALLTTAAVASVLAAVVAVTFYLPAREDAGLSPEPPSSPTPQASMAVAKALPQGGQRWRRHFPNVVLTTHRGEKVRFYDDLLKGKVVVINFMFTTCDGT